MWNIYAHVGLKDKPILDLNGCFEQTAWDITFESVTLQNTSSFPWPAEMYFVTLKQMFSNSAALHQERLCYMFFVLVKLIAYL